MQGDLDGAIECYQKALSINATSVESHNDLGVALRGKRATSSKQLPTLRIALELNPGFAPPPTTSGGPASTGQAGRRRGPGIHEALAIDPAYAAAHGNLGTLLMEQGLLVEAATCLERALELDPSAATMHSNLGIVLKRLGRMAEAQACIEAALALDPDDANAYQNLANVLHAQGKIDRVLECYRRALELAPEMAASGCTTFTRHRMSACGRIFQRTAWRCAGPCVKVG